MDPGIRKVSACGLALGCLLPYSLSQDKNLKLSHTLHQNCTRGREIYLPRDKTKSRAKTRALSQDLAANRGECRKTRVFRHIGR